MKNLFYTTAIVLLANAALAQNCPPATAYDFLDINNVKARINNGGDMWWDLENDAQYIVPKTGMTSALFAGAIWIGGVDAQGQLRLAAQTYRQTGNDFFPGPLDENASVTNQACQDFDRIWKINKSSIDSFIAGQFSVMPSSIAEWPGKGNPNLPFLPDQDLAPFVDVNGNSIYNPADGDYPDVPGDQALWFVINDKGNIHSETGATPIGIEVQCTIYAFEGTGTCLNNTTFYHYKLLNKSSESLDSTFVGLWTDPDLGCAFNDYFGCDTLNNLGIVYNATSVDEGSGCVANYGDDPPILAIDFLKGPEDENGNVHYMDQFMYYNNDFTGAGNPQTSEDYYGYLQSIFSGGNHLTNPDGEEVDFAYPGDPADLNGWSMCTENSQPSDFRFIMSSGPFRFDPGDVQTMDFSVVWDDNSVYPCPSYTTIIDATTCAEDYFKANVVFTGLSAQPINNNVAQVFPTLVTQHDAIIFQLKNAEHLRIFDLAGILVSDINVKHQSAVNIQAGFNKGMYIYQVIFKDQSVTTGKFLIQ
ncbi:MAG: T9SS type A sorting domain-containing protein [Chitinophagales bacterium]